MDLSDTIQPKSDQQNYDDVAISPRTVTIERVTAGSAEQPVEIHLKEYPGRPYKPSKSMRRVLVWAWGAEGAAYAGRRMTLAGDPTVKFGGIAVGGIKISHLSHIEKPVTVALTVSRGKRADHTVQPLRETAPTPAPAAHPAADARPPLIDEDIASCTSVDDLRGMWHDATPDQQALIRGRVAELQAESEDPR